MRKLALEIAAATALTAAAIVAFATGAYASCGVSVVNAFARASATPRATSAAAYFDLVNDSAKAESLTGARSDRAAAAMFHESAGENGVATMRMLEAIEVPAGETVRLAPGGLHLMLTGLTRPFRKGESFDLILAFGDGCEIRVAVPIGGVAQEVAPHGRQP